MPFYSLSSSGGLVEAATYAALPATGATGTLYVVTATNTLYRWSGSAYVEVSASPAEVVEGANLAAFPATGAAGKIYVALDTGKAYRWGGSAYTEISAGDWATISNKPSTFAPSAHAASHASGGSDAVTVTVSQVTGLGGAATLNVGTVAGTVAAGDDSRLSNARTPTSHAHGNLSNIGQLSSGAMSAGSVGGPVVFDVLTGSIARGAFGTSAGEVCQANDSRLSDQRAPSSHAATHGSGGGDSVTLAVSQVTGLQTSLDAKAATSHSHGNITSAGAIGTASGRMVMTSTSGVLVAAAQNAPLTSRQVNLVGGYDVSPLTFPDFTEQTTAWTGNVAAGNVTGLASIATTASAADITTGTLAAARLPTTTVTPAAYGSASSVATFTVGDDGRLTAAGSTAIAVASSAISSGTIAAARLPLSTTAQALTGTDTATALTPQAMHLSRRGSGRAKFFELFTDFAVNGSGFNAGTDGVLFQPDFTGTGSSGSTNGGAGATLASFSGRVGAGLFACITGTTATGRSGFDSRETSTIFRFDTGTTTYETLIYLPNLADATDDYVLRIGFCQSNALSNDVMCFEYNRSNSANWVGVTGYNGGYSRVTSSVAVAAAKWILLRLVFTSTSCEFFVNDASIGTSTSNIRPDGTLRIGAHLIKTAGTTSRSALVDYVYVRHDFNSDRSYT